MSRSKTPAASADDPWLTRREAATYARCHPTTIDRAVHEGALRVAGTRGHRVFRRSWIDAWLSRGAP